MTDSNINPVEEVEAVISRSAIKRKSETDLNTNKIKITLSQNRYILFHPIVTEPGVEITNEKVGNVDPLKLLQNIAIIKMEP